MQVYLGVDVGKTAVRVGVFTPDLTLLKRWFVASADVPAALEALRSHLLSLHRRYTIQGVGVSIFGPLQVNPNRADYGAVIESSEAAWSDINVPALVCDTLGQRVFFDYDVNTGALAEAMSGAGKGAASFVYLSVGTGIGGVLFRDSLKPGYAPQLGHMYLPRESDDLEFPGSCRFHGACLQGLASGRAIAMRWSQAAEELDSEHSAWDLEARYLARACTNLIYMFSPENVVIGSSVSCVPGLIDRVNRYMPIFLKDFLEPELRSRFASQASVIRAALTPDSSLVGAAILAKERAGLLRAR
jgi:fructokinase